MGFQEQVFEIVKKCPPKRQTMLFSATMSEHVDALVKLSLKNPVRIRVNQNLEVAKNLTEEFVRVRGGKEGDREAMVTALCARSFTRGVLVFFDHKAQAHRMKIIFGLLGLQAAELHGNMTQQQRLDSLEAFKEGRVPCLLATDVASRGLDIAGVLTVINFEMPNKPENYVHRVGRTARAARAGRAVTLISDHQKALLKKLSKNKSRKLQSRTIPPEVVGHWRKKVESLSRDTLEVMKSERLEKEARQAEMLASKAQNMMEHAEEIYNRPEKKWFQTTKEKKEILDKAHEESTGRAAPVFDHRGRKGQIITKVEKGTTKPGKGDKPKPNQKNMSRAQRREIKFGDGATMDDTMTQKVGKAAARGQVGQKIARPSVEKKPGAAAKKRKREEASLEDRIINSKAKPSSKHRDSKVHLTKGGNAKPEFMSKGMKAGKGR